LNLRWQPTCRGGGGAPLPGFGFEEVRELDCEVLRLSEDAAVAMLMVKDADALG
jgi:hypothetical protein